MKSPAAQPTQPGNFSRGRGFLFICGNNADAKKRVAALLGDFGWGVIDVGGIESSRYLEAMCLVWVILGLRINSWNHAFKMLTN